ncbi:MAG: replication-relaxation family protein [Pirellulaceae bacterium]|nr:replication-relaxation family protein [Pirellulaceae bacterium]
MSHAVVIGKRDAEVLSLLEMTPATAAHLQQASATFAGEPFRDERRVRERLQTLGGAGLVQDFPAAVAGGGLRHYYRLTAAGYRMLHPEAERPPGRSLVAEIAPSRLQHAMATADVIVHTLVACHAARVQILKYHGDGQLTLEVGEYRQQPDCHFQLGRGGRVFNVLFEIDNATEPLDSLREQSIRTKLLGYESYQNWVLRCWREGGRREPRPAFRVVFLTRGANRANHILWLARQCAGNPDRRLVYAATQDAYLGEPRAATEPLLNDHHGGWQALCDLHPSARFVREPVRLSPPLAVPRVF